MHACRLLTFGDSPVIAVEQLDAEGQQLLQRGLQPPPLPAAAAAGLQQVQQQVGDLCLGLGAGDAGGRQSEDSSRSSGLELHVPKEVQRLLQFLQVRFVLNHCHCKGHRSRLRRHSRHDDLGDVGSPAACVSAGRGRPCDCLVLCWLVPQAPQRLRTPGLFVDSLHACLGSSSSIVGDSGSAPAAAHQLHPQQEPVQLQQLLAATAPVRWALDTGLDLPGHVSAHQAAAALLLLLQQLPDSFLPPDVSGVLMQCVPPAPACMSLLSDTMSVAEWATLRMLLGLCKAALAPEAAASNGLTVVGLANVLAEHCFGDAAGKSRS